MRHFGRGYLASRFGKRTFVLLIVLVITPVTVAALVAVAHLEYELRDQAHASLHRNAKEYGLSILQRLVLVQREASYTGGTADQASSSRPPFHVAAVDVQRLIESARRASRLTDTRKGAPSSPILTTASTSSGSRIYMIVHAGGKLTALEIDPGYVWGPEEALPLPHLCVTGSGGELLHCSTSTARALLRASLAKPRSKTSFETDLDGLHYLGYAWDVFLRADFGSPAWRVYAFESQKQALAPSKPFKYLFIPAIVALIAGTLLLGVIQIRRRLEPLDQLVTGTRKLAEHDFNARVDVHSGDEFEDLAAAFNSMAERLGTQIGTLETLSSIDKTILKTLDVQIVATHVLKGLNELTSASWALIAAIDRDSPEQGRICYITRTSGVVETKRARMEFANTDWTQYRNGVHLPPGGAGLSMLEPLSPISARFCFAIPFFSDGQLDGVLCIGFSDATGMDDATQKTVEDFADRLAVATAAEKKEKLLQQQANFDSLTGLPNRFLFKDRLERALIHARSGNHQIAVLFLDLDRFKTVNDTLGHSHGDRLLVEAASRLMQCIDRNDTLARLGGDEFVILISGHDSIDPAVRTADRIIHRFAEPFRAGERDLMVSASIGIAVFPEDGVDSEELLRNADTAMYATKEHGRGSYYFYDQSMNRRLRERAQTESDLWRAVRDREFELWYQPQVDVAEGRVSGAEALLRWRHPERGIVGPDQFISLAEELGLIETIGSQALELACRQYAEWRAEGLVLDRIAVNVSPREFKQEDYVARVHEILQKFGMPPLRLTLEITENLLVQDTEMVMKRLLRLKEEGVSFSIDDFGIGYSSLAYLKKLPIDSLKIDSSFVRDVTSNEESAAIVSAILDMAKRLNIDVIAEGVETDAQLGFLRERGCDQIQGYIYSRPLHPDEMVAFSRSRPRNPPGPDS